MKDVRIIPNLSGQVTFKIEGQSEDTGLLLLQRLYVMLFSDPSTGFRDSNGGQTLLTLLDGCNIPPDDVMNQFLTLSCTTAVSMLDAADRKNIKSFTGKCTDGKVICTLVLADGTTVRGQLNG